METLNCTLDPIDLVLVIFRHWSLREKDTCHVVCLSVNLNFKLKLEDSPSLV